jgi:hypothetical protein
LPRNEEKEGSYLLEYLLAQTGGSGVLSVASPAQGQALFRGQVAPLAVLGTRLLGRKEKLVLDVHLDGLRRRKLLFLQKLFLKKKSKAKQSIVNPQEDSV